MSSADTSSVRFPSPRQGAIYFDGGRSFGRRQVAAHRFVDGRVRLGGVDHDLPDMRRRITESSPRFRARLPLAICGALMASASAVLWTNVFGVAHVLAAGIQ